MNTYFLRCKQADVQTLIALGITLGALVQHPGENGQPATITATHGGHWDVIGPIYRPTGELDDEGMPLTAPMLDDDGNPWWHANLTTPVDLGAVAAAMATEHPEIAEGLADLSRFFVVDEENRPKAPAQPYRVLAGWTLPAPNP